MDHAAHAPPIREIGDELYALAPSAFTAARDAHVARARAAGDRRAATALAGLKRPTVAGWLVNLVALARPDLVDDLTNLGATIRRAQGSVAPAALRDLSGQRRRMIDALLTQARTLANAAGGPEPSRQHLAEAEATFAAAMADEDTAGRVRSGRVLKAVSYSGFGQPVQPGEPTGELAGELAGEPTGEPIGGLAGQRTGAQPPATEVRATDVRATDVRATDVRAAEARVDQARVDQARRADEARAAAGARVAQAQASLERTARAERDENTRVQRLVADIAELRERLASAQRDAHAATQARLAAERDLASARRRLDRHG